MVDEMGDDVAQEQKIGSEIEIKRTVVSFSFGCLCVTKKREGDLCWLVFLFKNSFTRFMVNNAIYIAFQCQSRTRLTHTVCTNVCTGNLQTLAKIDFLCSFCVVVCVLFFLYKSGFLCCFMFISGVVTYS